AIQDISEVAQARQALQAHQAHLEQTVRERTAELETARQEAERLSQVKSAFLANMSHEIRTPLHGVLGLAQIGLREHSGTAHRTFARILESGEVLLGVVNDILDFSKIEAGMLHVEAVPVPLPALLHRAGAQIQAAAQAKGLALRIEVSDALPPACLSDPLRLEQILLNLLSNALKFTTAGQITLAAGLDQGQLHLSVRDTGIGMSADQQARLFRPFEQADGSTTRQYGGTGLGLSITHRLTELLGGRIAVHSQPGRGTCFDVWLPLRTPGTAPPAGLAPRPPAAARPPAEPATPVPRLAGLRVLAAEDNPVNQMVLKEFLRMEGARVTLVDNGQSAVDTVAQQGAAAFDVVLMDIQMPGMDGYEATRRLRGLAPDLPVIGQTAHAMPEEHAKCLGAGMVDLVVKPIDFAQLVETVGRHVRAPQTD
ncbi:MAG TPA: ATP-binding protein, partial [Aquabacterium sp.]|nr:ATP-binding protein [Aquabacterium sp.]